MLQSKNYHPPATILVLIAMTIAMFLLITALAIDAGRILVIKTKLQSIADQSVNAGASIIGDLILTAATNHQNADPKLNTINDPLQLITEQDIQNILNSESEIIKETEKYLNLNSQNSNIEIQNYQIIYPYNYITGDSKLFVKIIIEHRKDLIFGKLIREDFVDLKIESVSAMQI